MNLPERINAFVKLGERLMFESKAGGGFPLEQIIDEAKYNNPWFTSDNVRYAINIISTDWLTTKSLNTWVEKYPEIYFNPKRAKRIGVVMAGNIPLVGFHDLLCTLITGHRFLGKLSSKDGNLMKIIVDIIFEINSDFTDYIRITDDNLKDFDAVIATGSNNTAKYFEYYFKNHPSIIRKHRNSIAVLTGNETTGELTELSNDIFIYFGLGCRNVSKIFVPVGYNFDALMNAFEPWKSLILNNKYANNYESNKVLFLMNRVDHLDNGFLLIRPDESIGSPVGVLHYQRYKKIEEVTSFITTHTDEIQCIVARDEVMSNSIPFGKSQHPSIDEYADGIDTIRFLNNS